MGATWGPDGTIVFKSNDAPGLMQVSQAGGEPRPLTEPPPGGTLHLWPKFAPGGEAVLYTTMQGGALLNVAVVSLESGAQKTLVPGTSPAVTASGHLVFARREASLWAVPFDTDQLTVSGEPTPIVEDVYINIGGWAPYALADDGTLVYQPTADDDRDQSELVWVDRLTGAETPLGAPPRAYRTPRISPDGTRVAVQIDDRQRDLWVWDLAAEILTPVTSDEDAGADGAGEWTPDSQRVIFGSTRTGSSALFWQAADGTGTAQPLGEGEGTLTPQAVAPNGSVVVATEVVGESHNLITMSLTGDPVREDLLVTESDVSKAVFSPNGQWFAYMSSDSGVTNVYVRPFPNADSAGHPISTNGGTNPMWAPDGRELFYADLDGRLLAVPVQTDPTFARLGTATVALEGDYRLLSFYLGGLGRPYDIDQSGERFLVLKSKAALGSASRSVPLPRFVLN